MKEIEKQSSSNDLFKLISKTFVSFEYGGHHYIIKGRKIHPVSSMGDNKLKSTTTQVFQNTHLGSILN